MATQWYYARGGQQQGPVSFEELQAMAVRGQISGGDLVWSEGMANWSPASSVANLMPPDTQGVPAQQYPAPQQPGQLGVPGAAPSGGEQPERLVQAGTGAPATDYQGPRTGGMQMGYGGYGGYGGGAPAGPPPPNHLVWAILSTIFCCWPLGIVSIVYAAQVNSKWYQGDYQGSQQSSQRAKMWAMISAVSILVFFVVYVAIMLIAGVSSQGRGSW